ncbi:MAG: hypothetical protein VB934_10940, partial [Polyangiaceae bacterium]
MLAKRNGARVLLFVNQLEELVTLVDDEAERQRFMVALCRAADDPLEPVRIVLTVRDDFLGRVVSSTEVREALGAMFFLQRPRTRALQSIVHKPVVAAGYAYDDPNLPAEMVAAVGDEPACLPLLQFAAQQLWEGRDTKERLLLRSVYEAMGGVEGALAEHADGVLDTLSATETRAAKLLLLRLVTEERTRRVVPREELLESLGAEAESVLELLIEARLLTVRRSRAAEVPISTIEIAHESLMARWGTFRKWLDAGHEDLVFLTEARQAAELWEKRGRRAEELWEGEALLDATRALGKFSQPVPDRVAQFVAAAQRRSQRRKRRRRGALAAVLVLLSLVVIVLVVQNRRLDQQSERAERERRTAQELRATALVEGARAAHGQGKMLEARAKLRQAFEIIDTASARALWWQLLQEPLLWRMEFGVAATDVAFRADGGQLAVASPDKSVYLVDAKTRAVSVLRGHTDQVLRLDYSSDGVHLVSSDRGGSVRVWDAVAGRQIHALRGHKGVVRRVQFSPDGRLILT